MMSGKLAVVALGGNAISPGREVDTIANQFHHSRESLGSVVRLIREGYNLAITHGNGPQVGNAMMRVEMARAVAPELPVGICVADVAGGMGYMIEQSLGNRLLLEGIERDIVTIITQVVVDRDDPSMTNPNKFVGLHYTEREAKKLVEEMGWDMRREGESGWRRVVPSPLPRRVLSAGVIKRLADDGIIVVTAGGGGVPAYVENDGTLEGVDGVIDKDRTSAILASEIGASLLVILTDTKKVYLHFGTESQEEIDVMDIHQAAAYLEEGHFPRANMGPKIEAAIDFLQRGGEGVVIASIGEAFEAVEGRAGTRIVPG